MLLIRAIAGTLPMLLLLLGTSSASAQTPAEFFKGKQIALLVGFGPGGEDDLWARLLSRHLTTHIPGNPNVIPQNIPGSAGLLVANRLYNTAPRDGSVIGMINRGIPFEPLLGGQGTQFDPLKINYIGSPGRDTTVCAARKDAPVQSVEDLYRRELTVGGTGSGADTAIYPEFLSALLGMKFKLVKGYRGSQEIRLAMERNEVQGICLAYDSLTRGSLGRSGEINLLLRHRGVGVVGIYFAINLQSGGFQIRLGCALGLFGLGQQCAVETAGEKWLEQALSKPQVPNQRKL